MAMAEMLETAATVMADRTAIVFFLKLMPIVGSINTKIHTKHRHAQRIILVDGGDSGNEDDEFGANDQL